MFRIKKLLCLLLAVMMICSLLPAAAFADGAGGCTKQEDCAAETHEEGCPKFVPAESSCTKGEDCAAETHEEGCPKFVPAKSSCTKGEDCAAETHEEGCPKFVPAKSSCTKGEDCTAETHEEGCLSLKKGEPEPEVPAAVHAFLDAVAAIVIPENPEEMDEDSRTALEAQLDVAMEACEELSQEEQQREDVLAAWAIMSAAMDLLDGGIEQYEAGDWDPTTSPDDVEGTLVGSKNYKSSFTFNISTSTTAQLRAMPILDDGYYYYNATAYCGATATSNNKSVIDVQNITIGKYSGGVWDGADCLQINGELKGPGRATVTAYYYYTFSQNSNPFKNPNAQWFYAKHTFNIQVNMDHTLSYDANGGTGAPASQTQTLPASSYDFTVSSTEPTWENHTFLGWAESADAQTAQYHAKDKVTVEGSKTLYAVWEENTPPSPVPTAPSDDEVNVLLKEKAVTIDCVNETAGHNTKTYGLISGSYDIGKVTGDETNGYECTITISAEEYVDAYNDTNGEHELDADEPEEQTITLKYEATGWTVPAGAVPVVFKVTCATPPASDIDWDGLIIEKWIAQPEDGIIGPGDDVHYKIKVTNNTGNKLKNIIVYDELDSRLTYQSSTTHSNKYDPETNRWVIESLGKGKSTELDLHVKVNDDASGTIPNVATIIGAITKDGEELPGDIRPSDDVSFTVDGTTPDKPTDDALKKLFGQTIMVRCNNSEATHEDKTYGLLAGSYDIGQVTGDAASGYTCTITVSVDPYVAKYNNDVAPGHELADGQPTSQDITLSYDLTNSKWKLPNLDGPITFNVKCGDEPASTYTYSLSYNANTSDEVTGMPASNPDTYTGPETSHIFTVSSANPQRNGYTFKGWAETASATTANAQDSYTLTSEKPTMTLYAVWEQNTTQPTPPPELGKPDDATVKRLLPQAVKIDCVNGSAEHADQTYGLLEGSYSIGEPYPSGSRSSAFYCCDITILAAKYVEKYNETNAGHNLATGEALSKTITLKYEDEVWTVLTTPIPVVFRVVCSPSQPATDWSKLTITKTVSPTGTVMPGDTVTYTITVTNNTGKPLRSITVSEALDSRLELLGYTATGSYDAANGIWSFPVGTAVFANGSSATLTITAKVKANATGTINNTATITGAVSGEEELTLDPSPSSSVSITVGTPAPMNTFTLRYNANGGSGAPSSQSVETTADSVVMTVSSVQPTRHGYHFCGWALTPNGHVAYRSGNEITLTGDVTLYAVWATPTSSPQTGDSSNVALWAAMAGISLAAGAVVLFVLKKRKAE
ncbi:MAG: InlB B-repeat-containing protein [Faecousia sp.]